MATPVHWIAVRLVAVAAALAAASSPTPDPEALAAAFREAFRSGRWQRAIEIGETLDRVQPDQWRTRYTLACAHARAGHPDRAFDWLALAVESGFLRRGLIREDGDLASLRGDPRFDAVLRAIDVNWGRYAAWLEARCEEAPPVLVEPREHDPRRPTGVVIALHGHGGRPDGYPEEWGRVTRRAGLLLACPASHHPLGQGFTWAGVEEAELLVELTLGWIAERHAVDPDRVVLTGFSQGGWIAFALAARHPERFAGVIPMACGFVPELDTPPPAPRRAPPFYFMVGSNDRALASTREAERAFALAGYRSSLRVYRSTGHTFPTALVPELERALEFVLPRGAPGPDPGVG